MGGEPIGFARRANFADHPGDAAEHPHHGGELLVHDARLVNCHANLLPEM